MIRIQTEALILLIIIATLPLLGAPNVSPSNPRKTPLESQTYVPHRYIEISSNAGFSEKGFSGSGTVDDPYVIEGLNITEKGMTCIRVVDTDAFFVVRNCILASEFARMGIGAYFENVMNGRIENCVVLTFAGSINLKNCIDCSVVDNSIKWSMFGIGVNYCQKCTIERNFVREVNYDGVSISESPNCRVSENTILDVYFGRGMRCSFADKCQVTDNAISRCYSEGIWMQSSENATISGNSVTLCGEHRTDYYSPGGAIFVSISPHLVLSANTVSDNSENGICISGGDLLMERNTVFQNNASGVFLLSSQNAVVRYNLIYDNRYYGLYLEYYSGASIYENNIGYNEKGNGYDDHASGLSANLWDDGSSKGNGWSDYTGSGVYEIPGSSNSVDRYPREFKNETDSQAIDQLTLVIALVSIASVFVVVLVSWIAIRRRKP